MAVVNNGLVIEGIDRIQDLFYSAYHKAVVWLNLARPLSADEIQWLKNYNDGVVTVEKIGPAYDRRIGGTEVSQSAVIGAFQQPLQLAIALPTGAQIRTGAALAGEYAAAIGRWAINLGKVGVAFVVGSAAMNLTDPDTGPQSLLTLGLPLLLILGILYLLQRKGT